MGLWGGSYSTYGYVRANPLLYRDPKGLFLDEYGTYTGATAIGEATGVTAIVAAAGVTVAGAVGVGIGLVFNSAVEHLTGDSVGGLIYNLANPAPAALAGPTGPPPAANDPNFGGGDCPPDCRAYRTMLNGIYQSLTQVEAVPQFQGTLDLQWRRFWQAVRDYERRCGPYTPPPPIHDIYTK